MNPFMGSNEFNMKQLFLTILSLFCIISSVFADGTKQFMPNCGTEANPQPKGQCYLALGSREGGSGPSRAFARYNGDGSSCGENDRLYIRIDDCNKEKIYFGVGGILHNEGDLSLSGGIYKNPVTGQEIKYRLRQCAKDDGDLSIVVDNGLSEAEREGDDPVIPLNGEAGPLPTTFMGYNLPTSGNPGYINNYQEAYYGPKIVDDDNGYNAIEITVPRNGLYYLEFYIGHDIGSKTHNGNELKPLDFKYFDVSVVNYASKTQVDGRIYSRSWGLTTNGATAEAWSTFYTFSNDHYTSKVYLAGVMPYRFVFCCNSFGAIKTSTMEENRRSYPNPDGTTVKNYEPEYKIFTTAPDEKFYGTAAEPNLPNRLSFAGDAMTCEDLIFVMQLLNKEDATIELYLNSKDEDGETVTKTLIDVLKSSTAEKRGYHYPWKDNPKLNKAGIYEYIPITPQDEVCERQYKLSLFDQRYTFNGSEFNIGDTTESNIIPLATLEGASEDDFIFAAIDDTTGAELGSAKNPILISSKAQLDALAYAVNNGTNFSYTIPNILTTKNTETGVFYTKNITKTITNIDGFKDIHFYITAKTGKIVLSSDWEGIGTLEHPFKGIMRNGKYIPDPIKGTDATIDDQNTITFNGAGKPLFNYCEDATLDNIHVSGEITLHKDNYTTFQKDNIEVGGLGGICGVAKSTIFSYCSNTINLKPSSDGSTIPLYTGGIVGYADNCTIDSCKNYGEIDSKFGSSSNEGGICGYIINSTQIKFCYNVGLINSQFMPGGVVGTAKGNNSISNCKNINSIAADDVAGLYAGGIIGFADGNASDKIEIFDCYNSGNISAPQQSGGIIGSINNVSSSIKFCYNTGIAEYAIGEYENEEDGTITNCLSTGEPKIYISATSDIIDETAFMGALNAEHFETNGTEIIHKKTQCCGSTWRLEEAGRLYKSDNTFYLAWDGKFDNGDCVTGEVTVNYQKNTGVTHFPFYDPENIKCNNSGLNGLVVYSIRPEETGVELQDLPLNYYRTGAPSSEKGVEMKLYWDDSKIFYNKACDKEYNKETDKIGKTVKPAVDSIPTGNTIHYFDVDLNRYTDIPEQVPVEYCINTKNCKKSTTKALFFNPKTGKYESSTKYYCVDASGHTTGGCGASTRYLVLGGSATEQCQGIDNSRNGYLGSHTGHIFPIETSNSDGFGNKHIINTWWNGIEKAGVNTLNLRAYSPAEILPIIISKWMATSLSESVLLEWTTSSEENNSYFIVERSINGRDWERIGKVLGSGTTSIAHSYSLEDTHPVAGISYYRLKQTDFNGEYSYSSVKCVNRPKETEDYMTIYTNANTNTFVAEGESIAACTIEVHDILGHKITNISFNTINPSKVAISVENLPVGTYIVTCCNKSKTVIKNWK